MIAAVAVSLVVLAAWIYLLSTRSRLDEASVFDLIDTREAPERWPPLSVVVPARNEAETIRFTLPSLLSFYYPQSEVILVDDGSEDGTAQAAAQIAEAQERDNLRIIAGTPPPPGWLRKPWALEQGARVATGEWLLFSEPDIFYHPSLPRDLIRLALNQDFQMASLVALFRAESFWDRLLIPAFFFFFHLLYPFHRVRKPESPVAAAAAGDCVLVDRAALDRAGGLEAIRQARADDQALARALKRSGASIYLGATVQAASFRRFGSLKAIRQMVMQSALTGWRDSWVRVIATLIAMLILFGVPITGGAAVTFQRIPFDNLELITILGMASGFATGFMIAAYIPVLRLYRLPVLWGFTLPAAALMYAAMLVESALRWRYAKAPFERSISAGS